MILIRTSFIISNNHPAVVLLIVLSDLVHCKLFLAHFGIFVDLKLEGSDWNAIVQLQYSNAGVGQLYFKGKLLSKVVPLFYDTAFA